MNADPIDVHRTISGPGLAVIQGLLSYDPARRLTADEALADSYFVHELPRPETPSQYVSLTSSIPSHPFHADLA